MIEHHQYRLRTLLFIVTTCAVFSGMIVWLRVLPILVPMLIPVFGILVYWLSVGCRMIGSMAFPGHLLIAKLDLAFLSISIATAIITVVMILVGITYLIWPY